MNRNLKILTILFVILIVSFVVSVMTGSVFITPSDILNGAQENDVIRKIIFDIRLPRVLNSLFIGAALSCSGIILQSLLRNNLAESGLLGISAGAGLGAIIFFIFSFSSFYLITPISFISALLLSLIHI